jgi:hypothetical protein
LGINISQLKRQIQGNCDVSDAGHGGLYSLCSLLLRLRDLYKWENGLPPWREPEPADLLEWVDARERLWDGILSNGFVNLTIGNQSFDPFDVEAINTRLQTSGLVYGAGYAAGMKPSFFLAESVRSVQSGDLKIDVVDRELARDLFITPAMRQGNQIFARRSAMLFLIWDQILEMRPSARKALEYALAQYNLRLESVRRSPEETAIDLRRISDSELEAFVYHEVGEASENVFRDHLWHEIVSTYSNSPIEIYARVIKDVLADTHSEGLLGHIIRHRLRSSLGFYISFMRSFSRLLLPRLLDAFDHFRRNESWTEIEEVRDSAYCDTREKAVALVDFHKNGRERGVEWARVQIMSNLIEPLGISSSLGTET